MYTLRNPDVVRNKKITVLGLARSGLACANLLARAGACVCVSDSCDNEVTRRNAQQLAPGISVELGRHSQAYIRGQDLVVISPGIADTAPPVQWANAEGIEVVSEIEVAWWFCPAAVIAITGTNGKTTVTTLIGRMLEASGKKAFVCGNIGNPFSGEVQHVESSDYIVLEVSSFQLEKIKTFKPAIAVILNVSRNHLDRYENMQEYANAKKRIFLNQDNNDVLILNQEDASVREMAQDARSRVIYFSRSDLHNPNQAAVAAVGEALGIAPDITQRVFDTFAGIEHRLERVREVKDVVYVNDSKATTVDSTIWALRNTPGPIILIAGGREKGNDYGLVRDLIRQNVKRLIVMGEAKERIGSAFKGMVAIEEASGLSDAVTKAQANAVKGDTVLFSPMCKSFDMFANYEERGRMFKQLVFALS
ncbi:MAG: UDP-N-acetylmuramoyl-L-alanine--D-glutamate ligase [Candidatus Omnitrophica bacterium]|nr:UDP-N-acetylmuramoyl-L-alanine--D-glutamate ligase [Candidatus Omnitrophota bacterium]